MSEIFKHQYITWQKKKNVCTRSHCPKSQIEWCQRLNIKTHSPAAQNSQRMYLHKRAKICMHTQHTVSRLLTSFPPGTEMKNVSLRASRYQTPFTLFKKYLFIQFWGFGGWGSLIFNKTQSSQPTTLLHLEQLSVLLVKLQQISAVLLFLFRVFCLSSVCLTGKDKVHIRFVCIFQLVWGLCIYSACWSPNRYYTAPQSP